MGITNPDILPEQNDDNMFDDTYLADVSGSQLNQLKRLGQYGNKAGSASDIKELVPEGTFDSITDDEWKEIFQGTFKV